MRNKNKMYEVEIKSQALLREGKKGFITYFKGGTHQQIISNLKILYPQYMNVNDKPNVNITPITMKEYQSRIGVDYINQKQHLINAKEHIL